LLDLAYYGSGQTFIGSEMSAEETACWLVWIECAGRKS